MCVCAHIYIYIIYIYILHMCVCVYIYIYIHTHICIHIHINLCISIYCVSLCIHECVCSACTNMQTRTSDGGPEGVACGAMAVTVTCDKDADTSAAEAEHVAACKTAQGPVVGGAAAGDRDVRQRDRHVRPEARGQGPACATLGVWEAFRDRRPLYMSTVYDPWPESRQDGGRGEAGRGEPSGGVCCTVENRTWLNRGSIVTL